MKHYIEVCAKRERLLRATVLRPWYVLGPGHRWPIILSPVYWLAERISKFREGALRNGFVTLEQMLNALAHTVATPPNGVRVWEVPHIRVAPPGVVSENRRCFL